MNNKKELVGNKEGYNLWSYSYDLYPNPTVAMDEMSFPQSWNKLTNQRVLEIGCGTGRHTKKLTENGNRVIAIDLSEGMLRVAREKIPSQLVEFICADFLNCELKNSEFDFAVCSLVVEHIQDLRTFFSKVRQTLKPRGRFFLSEIHPERAAQGILAHFKKEDGDEIHLSSHFHSDAAIIEAATIAGFEIIASSTILGSEELAGLNPKWRKHLGHPMIKIWEFGCLG